MDKQAVIFDLDGVVTDTAELHYRAWQLLGQELGFEVTRETNEQLKGISRLESLDIILRAVGLDGQYTLTEKEALASKKNKIYLEMLETIGPADILPGIDQLIRDLKQLNLKLGLASASQNATHILRKLGLFEYFDTIVDPKTLKEGKPSPEIFLVAARALKVNPADCIGIEDSQAGIEAIESAGMVSIAIGDSLKDVPAAYHFSSTGQLLGLDYRKMEARTRG